MSDTQTTAQTAGARKQARTRMGMVIRDGAQKTRTVEVTRLVQHPMYKKYVRRRTRVHVHDEKNESHQGDMVEICESRPLSRTKRWKLVRIVVKGKQA